jgi:putative resolvase
MLGLLSIGAMSKKIGVSIGTLRRWEKEGKITPPARTLGGHRRYDPNPPKVKSDITVLYARVSGQDQKQDLQRQEKRLLSFAEKQGYCNTLLISDLGSGLNYKKRGLLKLLDMILAGSMSRLVVENKDRLLRFGSELIFKICRLRGIEIVIVESETMSKSKEEELARDVLEILTVFSAKLYGSRSKNRKILT